MYFKKIRALYILSFLSITLTSLFVSAHANVEELSAHRIAGRFEDLNLKDLPSWSKDTYRNQFVEIRDKKFLNFKGEKRRIPWFYVRDGCHMRSTHFTNEAERLGYPKPKKVFIFGSLQMNGTLVPRGTVRPWFHAAPIISVEGEAMVLDPTVSFSRPLSLRDWAALIIKDKNKVIYSICDADTYLPTSKCLNPEALDIVRLEKETQLFLKFEKNILNYLGLSFK